MTKHRTIDMRSPSGDELKAARLAAGLSQVEAAQLMAYPVQQGSRGGLQSRTWQALESAADPRTMPGPIFAMFQLLTQQHPSLQLLDHDSPSTRSDSHES
ncbi:XRE family transcriptional regulator [Roseateles sp.]|uniref:helix-turn-helix domain-containing protein n=1 Tax=Roseateles sp. TaxID=1971397 RepID=UPI00286C0A73|nr:XRE family transcriptional regulator [Roseateles sp.]